MSGSPMNDGAPILEVADLHAEQGVDVGIPFDRISELIPVPGADPADVHRTTDASRLGRRLGDGPIATFSFDGDKHADRPACADDEEPHEQSFSGQ